MRKIAVAATALLLAATALPSGASHEVGHTTVFARVGQPGMPEGIAVRDGIVYVSTHTSVRGNRGEEPSRIFRYSLATGALLDSFAVSGQTLNGTHGLLSMAFDGEGRLYVLDRNPSRLLRFTFSGGTPSQETYATFPELEPCATANHDGPCSPTTLDEPNFVDYFAFDADGNAYVTDLQAATIWKVPANGAPQIWFQDARLDGLFGANGIAVGPDGKIYFAMTGSQQPGRLTQGIIYRLPRTAAPGPGDLEEFAVYPEPATGPDGIAFGASGRLYVALAGANQVSILNPDGTERARFPDAVSNATQEIPYDLPASIAFDGSGSILVTNQSFFAANPSSWAVLRAWVGDIARPLEEPMIG